MQNNNEFKQMTLPEELLDQLPEPITEFILFQQYIILQQQERIELLELKVHELESRLSKNSSNSNKPPRTDGPKKPPKTTSQRGKSGKKPGGQRGRQGKTLNQVDDPDHIVIHTPGECKDCGHNLKRVKSTDEEIRQVFDIPKPQVEVTEHCAEIKQCPCCGSSTKGEFPDHVSAPVQYGGYVQALAVYFAHQHFIPFKRLTQIFEDIFDIPLSPGTCSNIDKKLFNKLYFFEENLKRYLLAEKVLNFDETGMRCNKTLNWIHVACSKKATFLGIHARRGQEAMDEFNILPRYGGIAIHDHWTPYFVYKQPDHGLCNSHHCRELTYIYEQEKENWAKEMKNLLLDANKLTEQYYKSGKVPLKKIKEIEKEYQKILKKGFRHHKRLAPLPKSKRGRQKQRVGKNLLDRLRNKIDCVLLFLYDLDVPFTNNQGEQDQGPDRFRGLGLG